MAQNFYDMYNFTLPRVLTFAGAYSTLAAIAYIATQDASASQIVNAGIIGLLGAAGTAIGATYIRKENLEQKVKKNE